MCFPCTSCSVLVPPEGTRQRAYGLVAQAYTSIAAQDFAAFVGYSVDEAVKGTSETCYNLWRSYDCMSRSIDLVLFSRQCYFLHNCIMCSFITEVFSKLDFFIFYST